MAKRMFLAGVTSQTIDIFIQDSSSTTGQGLASLVFNSSGLKAYYRKGATGTPTAITLATQTVGGAYSSGGFVELDATNTKGLYRFDIPDTVLASTPWAILFFYGATNMAPSIMELEIVSYNPFDSVRMGMTALPNAAAEASGGLFTRGTGAGQINQDANGRIDSNAKTMAGTTLTARDIGASVLLSSGTGTGQLNFTSGVVQADAAKIGGTSQTGRDLGASVLLSSGTGTGQLDFTSGVVKGNVTQVDGVALTSHASGKVPTDVLTIAGTTQTARDIGTSVLISSGTGTGQLDVTSGVITANASKIGGTTQTGRDIGTSVLLSSGTGTGQLDFTSGVVKANTTLIEGTDATDQIALSLLNYTAGVETGLTVKQALRLISAILVGISTGFPSGTKVFKSADISGGTIQGTTSRVSATTDSDGNRSSLTIDLT